MRVVDLSQEIHPDLKVFPSYPQPCILPWNKRQITGFESEVIFMAAHTGTHIDAPYHFDSDGLKVDQLPVDWLLSQAVLIDLGEVKARGKITANDIRQVLKKTDAKIEPNDVVIVKTGWSVHADEDRYVTDYPGLTVDAAKFLLESGMRALGVDSPDPDHPELAGFPVHNLLLPKGRLIIENLSNLDQIDRTRFKFMALPLKLKAATGSPIRAVAVLE
jgi:kynurenine formamidase